jgi:hypothetical protein
VQDPSPPHGYQWAFVALEYYALILNRVYLVLVGSRTLAGAYMRGPVMAVPFPPEAWQPGYWLNEKRLARYSGTNIDGPDFRRRHWANFQHSRSRIVDVRYNTQPKWGMGSVPYSGRIHISWADGRRREFILLGRQNGIAIRDRLLPSNSRLGVGADDAIPMVVFDPFRPLLAPGF